MADDSNDTQAKIDEEDRALRQKERIRSEGDGPDEPVGEFAEQGEAAMGGAMGGGPEGTGNTGGELPGGATSEFARTGGGQTEGVTAAPSFGNPATGGAQAGAIGSRGEDNEYGPQGSNEEPAEDEEANF